MQDRSSNHPRDGSELAKLIADIATGQADDALIDPHTGKNVAAVALGRLGGKKGGSARAAKLSQEERHRIAAHAAKARWGKNGDSSG